MKEIYCDSAATSKPNLKVLKRYYEFAKKYWANPSSLYFRGRAIKMALEECRERCAKQLDCEADEIYFTSGGTESNNMVLNNFINKDSIIFYSPIEHPSIMEILKKNESCCRIKSETFLEKNNEKCLLDEKQDSDSLFLEKCKNRSKK